MTEVRQPTSPEALTFKAPSHMQEMGESPPTSPEREPSLWELVTGSVGSDGPREHLTRAQELYNQWGTGATRAENFIIGAKTGIEAAHFITSSMEMYAGRLFGSREVSHQSFQAPVPDLYEPRRQEQEESIEELRAKLTP